MSNVTFASPVEAVINATTPSVNGKQPSTLISMRNIWKTYQMGTESVHDHRRDGGGRRLFAYPGL